MSVSNHSQCDKQFVSHLLVMNVIFHQVVKVYKACMKRHGKNKQGM